MNLSRTERWMLANQYHILELLNPAEAAYYHEKREALECGYELHYEWSAEHIYKDVTTEAECHEVVEILAMFRALKDAYEAMPNKTGINAWAVTFHGFDGNDRTEGKYMGYARYFCSTGGGRFTELERGDNFNSHFAMLERYRRQLAAWKASAHVNALTEEDVRRIAAAAVHPDNRRRGEGVADEGPATMSTDDRLATRLTAAIRAGHRFDYDLSYDPHRCGCEGCLRGDALMADLLQPASRAATERLLEQARAYREQLIITFDAACRRRSAEDGERARHLCGRLADELGIPLVDQIRRGVVRDYADHHGPCSWCDARDGWEEQISRRSPETTEEDDT